MMDKICKQVLRTLDAVNLTCWISFSIRRTFTMALLLGLLGMSKYIYIYPELLQ